MLLEITQSIKKILQPIQSLTDEDKPLINKFTENIKKRIQQSNIKKIIQQSIRKSNSNNNDLFNEINESKLPVTLVTEKKRNTSQPLPNNTNNDLIQEVSPVINQAKEEMNDQIQKPISTDGLKSLNELVNVLKNYNNNKSDWGKRYKEYKKICLKQFHPDMNIKDKSKVLQYTKLTAIFVGVFGKINAALDKLNSNSDWSNEFHGDLNHLLDLLKKMKNKYDKSETDLSDIQTLIDKIQKDQKQCEAQIVDMEIILKNWDHRNANRENQSRIFEEKMRKLQEQCDEVERKTAQEDTRQPLPNNMNNIESCVNNLKKPRNKLLYKQDTDTKTKYSDYYSYLRKKLKDLTMKKTNNVTPLSNHVLFYKKLLGILSSILNSGNTTFKGDYRHSLFQDVEIISDKNYNNNKAFSVDLEKMINHYFTLDLNDSHSHTPLSNKELSNVKHELINSLDQVKTKNMTKTPTNSQHGRLFSSPTLSTSTSTTQDLSSFKL